MKKIIVLCVLLIAFSSFGLNKIVIPQRASAGSVITASKTNENLDTIASKVNKLIDSLDAKFPRFTDYSSGDSTLAAAKADIDSFVGDVKYSGVNYFYGSTGYGQIKMVPSEDSGECMIGFCRDRAKTTSLTWAIGPGGWLTDGDFVIGYNDGPRFRITRSGNITVTGSFTTTTLDADSVTINGGSALTNFLKGTFVCSLYVNNNTEFIGYGTVQYQVVDSVVTLRFPYISGTITTSGTSGVNVRNVPASLRSSKSQQTVPVSMYENGGYNIGLFNVISSSLYFYFATSTSGSPVTGTFTVNRCVVQYFL